MSEYVTAGEGFDKICSDQDIISSLVELYSFNYKKLVRLKRNILLGNTKGADVLWAQYVGALDVLQAMLLEVVGPRATFEICEKVAEWAAKEE